MDFAQNSHQKSTTVWTTPQTDEQAAYFSKHAAERRVFGIMSALLQVAHGILAFAAFSQIFEWVLHRVPQALFLVPYAAFGTILAMHLLFRTTWTTYWYDKLDDDPNTDSPLAVPVLIMAILILTEVNGARMFLDKQVAPPLAQDAQPIEEAHTTAIKSIDDSYKESIAAITAVYAAKEEAATAAYDRQLLSLRRRRQEGEEGKAIASKISALEIARQNALSPILSAKAAELEKALGITTQRRNFEYSRRDKALATIDNSNAKEVARHLEDKGAVNQYAWVISILLMAIISTLLYRLVRINVKSGILPLRTYTTLDAHGSIAERLCTAFADAINRQGLRLAVGIHRALSPSQPLKSFDGTVVAEPGTYNTPNGFWQGPTDEQLRAKVFQKLYDESQNGGVAITAELLQKELEKAKAMNGSYHSSPLGKTEPSAAKPQAQEGQPSPSPTGDPVAEWASKFMRLIEIYDREMAAGRSMQAAEQQRYINSADGPIVTKAKALGLQYGIEPGDDEIVVWRAETPHHKVPLSMATSDSLTPMDQPAAHTDNNLFKSDLNELRQSILPYYENGQVIGVKYRKEDGTWSTLGKAATLSRWKIQQKYASVENPSPKVLWSLKKWQYAMWLIEQNRVESHADFEAITA